MDLGTKTVSLDQIDLRSEGVQLRVFVLPVDYSDEVRIQIVGANRKEISGPVSFRALVKTLAALVPKEKTRLARKRRNAKAKG